MAGEVDACAMIDGNHLLFTGEGTLPAESTKILEQTGKYDHCNFTGARRRTQGADRSLRRVTDGDVL